MKVGAIDRVVLFLGLVVIAPGLSSCGGGDQMNACPTEPDRSSQNNQCRILVGMCPHRGGDCIHDICADGLPDPGNVAWDGTILKNQQLRDTIDLRNGCPPNSGPDGGPPPGRAGQGCDVSLAGREFDALSWDEQQQNPFVWEMKTWTWSAAPQGCKDKKLQELQQVYIYDCNIVLTCNKGLVAPYTIKYNLALSDQPYFSAMQDWITRNANVLPPEAQTTCFIVDAQRCR